MYSNIDQFSYAIDCKFSQFCYPIEEPDQGYYIRQQLLKEIREFEFFEEQFQFLDEPQTVHHKLTVDQFLYEIDCKLSQYFYPIEEPDQGYFIREKLLAEIKNAKAC